MAEASGFLKGQNSRGWQANFDWLINESNMVKVLEGNYNSDMQQNRAPNSKWAKSVNDSSRDKQYSELEQRILNFGASDD